MICAVYKVYARIQTDAMWPLTVASQYEKHRVHRHTYTHTHPYTYTGVIVKDHTVNGVFDSNFVAKEFYTEPPQSDAGPGEWAKWLVAEDRKRAAHKAQHTKSLEQQDVPDQFQDCVMSKAGGVWRQGNIMMGFAGDAEDGTLQGELGEEAKQERYVIWADMEKTRCRRGTNRKGKSKRRRANRKARRKAARKGVEYTPKEPTIERPIETLVYVNPNLRK